MFPNVSVAKYVVKTHHTLTRQSRVRVGVYCSLKGGEGTEICNRIAYAPQFLRIIVIFKFPVIFTVLIVVKQFVYK